MVPTGLPKRRIMGWCIGSLFTIALCFVIFEIFYADLVSADGASVIVINLPNEKCAARPALVTVGADIGDYYPMMISLHRCGGVCGGQKSHTLRTCVAEKSNTVYLNARNQKSLKNETLDFLNHTSCSCQCVYDNAVCSETQVWDDKKCQCVCANSSSQAQCKKNEIWNPNFCQCECDLSCSYKQTLNETRCGCDCKSKYYKRCSRKQKVLNESDCRCHDLKSQTICKAQCSSLPSKWYALVIIISVCGIIIVAVDCILYFKGTGCVYTSTHMCLNDSQNFEVTSQNETTTDDDTADMVKRKSVPV